MLSDNYRLSENRLQSLCKRFQKDRELAKNYDKIFKDYERDGIIEKVPPDNVSEPNRVHYLPHRPVVRVDRDTSKVRPVFVASSKMIGPSLNDCLHTGPNFLSMIYDILIRFRMHKVIVMSDIKQAFLNVAVHPEHVDYLRFLWCENGTADEITIYRFLVVVFGLTPSPFLLQATIRYHCEKMIWEGLIDQIFVEIFLKTLYMDDSVNGAESVSQGFEIYNKSKWLMKTAGFMLRKWCSNSKDLMGMINTAENTQSDCPAKSPLTQPKSSTNPAESNITSVLGISWNVDTDEIIFDLSKMVTIAETIELTKRNILKIASTFFDHPLLFKLR